MKLRLWFRFMVLCVVTVLFGLLSSCGGGGGGGGGGGVILTNATDVSAVTSKLTTKETILSYLDNNGYVMDNMSTGTGDGWYMTDAGMDLIISANSKKYKTTFREVWSNFSKSINMHMTPEQFCTYINDGYKTNLDNPLVRIFHPDNVDVTADTTISSLQEMVLTIEVLGAVNIDAEATSAKSTGKQVALTGSYGQIAGSFLRGMTKVVVGTLITTAGAHIGLICPPAGGLVVLAGVSMVGFGAAEAFNASVRLVNYSSTPGAGVTYDMSAYDTNGQNKATASTYSISGTVTNNGSPLSGVIISISGNSSFIQTDSTGHYKINNLKNGNYTITPRKAGYTFTSKTVSINNNNQTQNFTASFVGYSISGRVTLSGSGLSGVSVSTVGGSATTDGSGNYTISGLPNGSYTVTASKNGYTLSAAQSVIINNANVTGKSFTSTVILSTYNISGRVTLSGSGLSGVLVSTTGGSATTDGSGNYTISGLPNGSYTVTASKTGYTLSAAQTATINNANVTGKIFTATVTTAPTYTISGRITLNGTALSGATVTLTGSGSTNTTTDSSGNYSFTGAQNGSYTVTPTLAGHAFTPGSKSVTVNGANATAQDFTSTNTGFITGSW